MLFMSKKFSRTVENFTCEHCGAAVTGNGYTNHCPHCLHSKHVDVNPGDRAENCGGLMCPVGLDKKGPDWIVIQKCTACGHEFRCKTREEDSTAVLKLAKTLTDLRTK
jgi:hypothetical protein